MFFIYGILNCLNGKMYIGKTNDLKNRWLDHLRIANGGKEKYPRKFSLIHQAITKYGSHNFEFFCIQNFYIEKISYEAEKYWIDFYKSKSNDHGYNSAILNYRTWKNKL